MLPRHIAVIMDGNGRWAKERQLDRILGHREGLQVVRDIVRHCATLAIKALTLFAFSSENWQRPVEEVEGLLSLFLEALEVETPQLMEQNIRLRLIGDFSQLSADLFHRIQQAQILTQANTGLHLVIALGYGGRWDIVQAAQKIAESVQAGVLLPEQIDVDYFAHQLCLADLPEPDLLIRTGGESRLSNFLLWQLAYTELYFTKTLWPDFNTGCLQQALDYYQSRERRFGRTSEQLC